MRAPLLQVYFSECVKEDPRYSQIYGAFRNVNSYQRYQKRLQSNQRCFSANSVHLSPKKVQGWMEKAFQSSAEACDGGPAA